MKAAITNVHAFINKFRPHTLIKLKRLYQQHLDDFNGRAFVGADRYGNKYYQAFNQFGLPTRRTIEYPKSDGYMYKTDVHFNAWLRKQVAMPPTQEQLQVLYLKDEAFKLAGLQYDKVEGKMMEDFRALKKLLAENNIEYSLPRRTDLKLIEGSKLPVMIKKEGSNDLTQSIYRLH